MLIFTHAKTLDVVEHFEELRRWFCTPFSVRTTEYVMKRVMDQMRHGASANKNTAIQKVTGGVQDSCNSLRTVKAVASGSMCPSGTS